MLRSSTELSQALLRGWFKLPGCPRAYPESVTLLNLDTFQTTKTNSLIFLNRTYVANELNLELTFAGRRGCAIGVGNELIGAEGGRTAVRTSRKTLNIKSPMTVAAESVELVSIDPNLPSLGKTGEFKLNNPDAVFTFKWRYPQRDDEYFESIQVSFADLREQLLRDKNCNNQDSENPDFKFPANQITMETASTSGFTTEASWKPVDKDSWVYPGNKLRLHLNLVEPAYVSMSLN